MQQTQPDVEVVHAVAAAIVTASSLPDGVTGRMGLPDQKFVVHPFVARVNPQDALLCGYLESIYADRPALQTPYPRCGPFAQLNSNSDITAPTKEIAEALATEMSKKNANPGILFGFTLRRQDASQAHGVIKADLDEEERFHMVISDSGQWSWDAVSELLPPPRTQFAKFAIAPQPGGVGVTGIRDMTENEAAAAYFLAALQLTVPKTTGTQFRVAALALRNGYTMEDLDEAFGDLDEAVPIQDFVHSKFERIPDTEVERLAGRPERPMPEVMPEDPYFRVYKTKSPRFELVVGSDVRVRVAGRTLTVTLPEGDQIEQSVRER